VSRRYPHELSGGQRQRVAIARALAPAPELLVLDEPVSSLDVSIRAQVINLLKDLQAAHGMAYLLIAHDLPTVRYLCQRVLVLHLGQVVEEAGVDSLFEHPRHPYTHALLSATLPTNGDAEQDEIVVHGDVASQIDPPSGCRFRERCPFAQERCAREAPPLRAVAPDQRVACHFAEDIAAGTAERTAP
jgi:oligopeptide/dipeptide ABC transporter ATP-binding protein